MTVSTITSSITYLGNGATTAWTFSFIGVDEDDVEVVVVDSLGNSTTISPSLYTVTINAIPVGGIWGIGGTVTYPLSGSALASGKSITINRIVPYTQSISINNQGAFYPQAVEQGMDLLELQIQQLQTANTYTIKAPFTDITPPSTLPTAAARANKYFSFDSSGNPSVTAISAPTGSSTTIVTDTITTLKAIVAAVMIVSPLYYVKGYTSTGDGGEGWFRVTTSNPGADNGGTIIWSSTTGYYFVRQYSEAFGVNVRWFGAKGDNSTNDTTAFVNAAATGNHVYVPRHTTTRYKVTTDNIVIGANGQRMFGDGEQLSRIGSFSSSGSIVVLGGQATLRSWVGLDSIGFEFDNSVARSSGQRCVKFSNVAYVHIHAVDTLNGLVNFELEDCLIYSLNDCYARNGAIGINLVPSATYYSTQNLCQFNRVGITGNTLQAVNADGSGNNEFNQLVFTDCDIEGNGTNGSGLSVCFFDNVGKTGVAPGVTFRNCWFEGNRGTRNLYLEGQNTSTGFVVENCTFIGNLLTTADVEVVKGHAWVCNNGLNVAGPTANLVFGTLTSGYALNNTVAILTNNGQVVTEAPFHKVRTNVTLAFSGSTTPGTQTYSTQVAKYSKIGSRVFVDFNLVVTALDAAMAGNVRVTGLPYTSVSDGTPAGGGTITSFQGINLPAGGTNLSVTVGAGVTYADVLYSVDAGSTAFLAKADCTATVTLQGTFSYDAASIYT